MLARRSLSSLITLALVFVASASASTEVDIDAAVRAASVAPPKDMRCVMFGVCDSERGTPCISSQPPQDLLSDASFDAADMLSDLCPTFQTTYVSMYESNFYTCCDLAQIKVLAQRLQYVAPVLRRCPACHMSFREYICEQICSPYQATFTLVKETYKGDAGQAVNHTQVAVSTAVASAFYDTCAHVKLGATDYNIMEMIFAASNYSDFLTFIGRRGLTPQDSPIQMDIVYRPSGSINNTGLIQECAAAGPLQCSQVNCPRSELESTLELASASTSPSLSRSADVDARSQQQPEQPFNLEVFLKEENAKMLV